jgi:hypothetical protein
MCEKTVGHVHESFNRSMMPLEEAVGRDESHCHKHVEGTKEDEDCFSAQHLV